MFLNSTTRSAKAPKQFRLTFPAQFQLESGESLYKPQFSVQTWGELNADKSNVVWVCHALTGNHLVHEWWGGLFGNDKVFSPENSFIVCVNVLGSCYGTTGPLCFNQELQRYYRTFPLITIRDVVAGLDWVRTELGIEKIKVLIGASLGGQQVLEWAIQQPELFEAIIPIATNVAHSPFGIAFNEAQRMAIEADETYFHDDYLGGKKGLAAARSLSMLSYRSYEGYRLSQTEDSSDKRTDFKSASYQRYQGDKLTKRFNAYSYWVLSKVMDSHNIARNREPAEQILQKINIPSLVVGIDSDLLFPLQEQVFIDKHLANSELFVLSSDYGHDGFLVEFEVLSKEIERFLEQVNGLKSVEIKTK